MTQVEQAWTNRTLVRWMATQWCNYKCSYCQQDHGRKRYYKGSPAHWADNRPWQDWLAAFTKHFTNYVTMHMTGGEPLLDRKNVEPLITRLLDIGWTMSIDTNGSFPCEGWAINKSPIGLQVSYHPTEVSEEVWFNNLERILTNGWTVDMVAYVAVPGTLDTIKRITNRLHILHIPINTHPLDFHSDQYSTEEMEFIRKYLPATDLEYRTGKPTTGNSCLYPSVSYEVDPDGSVIVSCHRALGPQYHGSIWEDILPQRPKGHTPCPREKCDCEERYTFQEHLGYNIGRSPKGAYSSRLKELQLC